MALLKEEDRQEIAAEFEKLEHPVRLVMFTQDVECQFCRETREISEELAAISEMVDVEVYDFLEDAAIADQYGVDKIPATIVMRGGEEPKDYGIRYCGIPSGYEFSSLVHDILMVGGEATGLSETTRNWLQRIDAPLHLQVFVTPTCPYCPQAVILAHQLAMESDLVTADMVEATEFPHLAMKYQVMGVPRTVINESIFQEGASPEQLLIARLQEAVNRASA